MKARARRTAISVASVPEEVKRTRSAEGMSRRTTSPQRTSPTWLEPKCVPRSSVSCIAVATEIIDILVAVDIPFARSLGALDIDAVRLDVACVMRDAARQDVDGLGSEALRAPRALAIGGNDLRVGQTVIGHDRDPLAPGQVAHLSKGGQAMSQDRFIMPV